jgi:hypothetical protein
MATEQSDIQRWLERGKENGSTHLIVVCDTFDHEDFPVFVEPGQDVYKVEKEHNGINMERVMEVYNISMDWESQLNQYRSFNY